MEIQDYTVRSLLPDPEQPGVLTQFVHYDRKLVLFRPGFVDGTSVSNSPLQLLCAHILREDVERFVPQHSRPCFVSVISMKLLGRKGPYKNSRCNRVNYCYSAACKEPFPCSLRTQAKQQIK
jgi:hypothetical protein